MAVVRRLGWLAALLGAASCEPDAAPLDPQKYGAAVHAMLHAGSDTASVLLMRYPPLDERRPALEGRITGAQVRIVHGTQMATLAEAPAGFPDCVREEIHRFFHQLTAAQPGCYAARLPGPIRPGARYELEAELPGGARVRGATVVPELPEILSPSNRARFVVRDSGQSSSTGRPVVLSVPVEWQPAGGGVYDVNLVIDRGFRGGTRLAGSGCIPEAHLGLTRGVRGRSTEIRLWDIDCYEGSQNVAWDSAHARVLVTAFDTAYARYLADTAPGRESVRWNRATAGVQGALGAFAAAATAAREITLVRGN